MQVTVDKILDIAKSWVGKSAKNGTHKEIIDVYNSQKKLPRGYKVRYSDYWCATFISALFVKAGAGDMIHCECSCEQMIKGMKALGIYIENENRTPAKGDIVFYDWNDSGSGDCTGWADHVGIVENVNGNKFTVIEGNYNNSVGRRTVIVNQRYLRGFATPKYAITTTSTSSELERIAKEVIRGNWGNGAQRKKRLESAGYNYKEVQGLVNKILKG